MSKWGIEEKETLTAIKEVKFSGNILNIAAGDGRFNNVLLELSDTLLAIDIDENELEALKNNCPSRLKNKLSTKTVDITTSFPFANQTFDGIFCTGTLHLFERETLKKILKEIRRVLKENGKIVLDFATDIKRLDKNGNQIIFEGEGSYNTEEAIALFNKHLKDFSINVETATFTEENLDDSTGYQFIKGNFLVISGNKKRKSDITDYEQTIKSILKDNFVRCKLISQTSNKVYKVETTTGETLYAKFYEGTSSHVDNELKVYDLVDNKYLKEIYYKSENSKLAIFKELVGKTVDELSKEELDANKDKIISSICDYFNSISTNKTTDYGILDKNLKGKFSDFHTFLVTRQQDTSSVLKDYKELSGLFDLIYAKYKTIMTPDNALVPIDTNLKNIMVLNDKTIIFSDPGEMISGPILMGYGDFVAHVYKTPLYDKLIEKLKLSSTEEKLLRIYAIFSSLNILAFLKKNGINDLNKVIPFGNTHTFYDLINEHLKYLELI